MFMVGLIPVFSKYFNITNNITVQTAIFVILDFINNEPFFKVLRSLSVTFSLDLSYTIRNPEKRNS